MPVNVQNVPINVQNMQNMNNPSHLNSTNISTNSDHIYIGKTRHGTGNTINSNIRVLPSYVVDPYENPDLMRQMTDRVNNQSGTLKSSVNGSARRYTSARRSKPCSQV